MSKNIKRILLTAVAAILLMVMTVAGTLAYLVSTTQTVNNTFTVGKIGITLDEAKVDQNGDLVYKTDADGKPTTELADRVASNSYKLMPGHTYVKDPTIHIDDVSEESYLRVVIKFTNAANTDALFSFDKDGAAGVFTGFDASKWDVVSNTVENDVRTYVLNYKELISGATPDIVLFTKVVVPGTLTNAQINSLENTKMSIVAYAIQKDGLATPEAAWAAYDAQVGGN